MDNKKTVFHFTRTAKIEYIVAESCCTQVICMKKTLEYLLVKFEDPIVIQCGNTSAINISKKPVLHFTVYNRSKVYFYSIMLYTSYLDEENIGIFTCKT